MNYIQWMNSDNIIAGTTLRNSELKENGNLALHTHGDLEAIIENRKVLSKDLSISLSQWVFAQQTHSDHLIKVGKDEQGRGTLLHSDGIADCDALYTKDKGVALGVFHADCVPILLYDPFTQLICAIHSGWQGTIKEITAKVISYLIENEHVKPENLLAYIGPAISYHSFEVGQDVIEKVQTMSFDTSSFITYKKDGKALVNNKGLNRQMLLNAHVPYENITYNRNDTFLDNDAFFSYRRDHNCGRHLSFIMMK
ncbi:MAG: peptidoglycan editing factor PgeF [Longicatena sp.]